MTFSSVAKYTASIWLAASLLTACGSGLQGTRPTTAPNQTAYARSWMAPDAGKQNLLYVSDAFNSEVYVYSYPGRKLEGTLSAGDPAGLCVDKSGDVFVTSRTSEAIFEYAHGGTQPIATIDDAGYVPNDCAVDLSTGELAVANYCEISGQKCIGFGNINLYKNASGTPVTITDSAIPLFYDCGYDSRGNLFAGGNVTFSPPSGFQLAELKKRQSTLENISLNRAVWWPAGVKWNGKYVVVANGDAAGKELSSILQVAVNGSVGTVVSTTRLAKAGEIAHFWIQGSTLIAPDTLTAHTSNVLFYAYPKERKPTAAITGNFNGSLDGATVSLAR